MQPQFSQLSVKPEVIFDLLNRYFYILFSYNSCVAHLTMSSLMLLRIT